MSVIRTWGLFGIVAAGLALTATGTGCTASSSTAESSTSAVSGQSFDKNDVLDDESLVAAGAMTEDAVQGFFEKTPYGTRSTLADYTTPSGDRASTVLHQAAVDNGINPLAMLVRLQMEEGLIHDEKASSKIDIAFGCGCESVDSCDDKYVGFENQATCMARTLRRDMDALAGGQATISGWQKGVAKDTEDGITVTPKNDATAALYTYTPWVGEAGGGETGTGGASLHYAIWKKFANAVGFTSAAPSTPTTDCAPDDPECTPTTPTTPATTCATSDTCSGTTPVCDTVAHKCVACQADYAAENAAPLACATADAPVCGKDGACVECSASNTSACDDSEETPVCVAASGKCGCTKDDDCDSAEYCDTSDPNGAGTCTSGCRVQGGADTCPEGQACDKRDGTVGKCAGEGCDQGGCTTAPNLVCDTTATTPSCVQCLADTDCSGGKICDTRAKKCVECTTTNKTACSATDKGAACLSTNVCGCAADSDCGNATSGRICDTASHTCKAGCRDAGGNGCPNGQTCTSGTQSAGTCKIAGGTTTPPSDAGAGTDSGSHTDSGTRTDSGSGTGSSSSGGSSSGGSSSGGSPLSGGNGGPHVPSKGNGGGGTNDPAAATPDSGSDSKKGCAVSGTGVNGAGEFFALAAIVGAFVGRRRRRA